MKHINTFVRAWLSRAGDLRLSEEETTSLVYLLFPTFRETLQGGFLEVFNLFSGQCSVYFPGKNSGENPRKSLFSLLNSF